MTIQQSSPARREFARGSQSAARVRRAIRGRKNVSPYTPNRRYWVAVRVYGNKRRLQLLADEDAVRAVNRALNSRYTRDQLDNGIEMYRTRADADYAYAGLEV